MNLSDVFSETDETETEVETNEADESSEVNSEAEADSTVEDDATTTVAEQDEAKPKKSEKDDWTYAAYQDEKRKRQELEERLKALETKKPEEDDTDYISQAELRERLQKEFDQKLQVTLFQDRLARNYDQVSNQHPDFKEMEKVFADMATRDPNLKAQFLASTNPAEFAYKHAKNYTLLSQYGGDVEALVQAKLEEAKKEFGLKPQEAEEKPQKRPKTPSLANATESEKNSAPVENISSLNEIFADSAL